MTGWSFSSVVAASQRGLADLFFPPQCVSCGSIDDLADDDILLCQTCRALARPFGGNFCPRCALPMADLPLSSCGDCAAKELHFSKARTLHLYQATMRELVLRMKYPAGESLAMAAGKWLGQTLQQQHWQDEVDVVLPIPMHWASRIWRGYHAADVIAAACAREMQLPLRIDLLQKRRWTHKQASLSRTRRLRNLRRAFGVAWRYDVKGCRVLLVDDVITTGTTVNMAAGVLRQAGATEVLVAAVARGTGQ